MIRISTARVLVAAVLVCAVLALLLIARSAGSPRSDAPAAVHEPSASAAGLVPWREGSRPAGGSRPPASPERALSVRALDDPAFAPNIAELGLNDPGAFLDAVPELLYALEPDLDYKRAVLFVHGLGGSARDFGPMVARLDRARYKPWFFHYPSGLALEQSAQLLYELLLSGDDLPAPEPALIIVAHDTGGLLAREALNLLGQRPGEARVRLLISVATPFDGRHSAAPELESGGSAAPVWRDLEPDSRFMRRLFRARLPAGLQHAAAYAYVNANDLTRGRAHDGVVTVSSQLSQRAQFTRVEGFQAGHAAILRDPAAIQWVLATIEEIAGLPPERASPAVAAGQR